MSPCVTAAAVTKTAALTVGLVAVVCPRRRDLCPKATGLAGGAPRHALRGLGHEGHQRPPLYRAEAAGPVEAVACRHPGQPCRESASQLGSPGKITEARVW